MSSLLKIGDEVLVENDAGVIEKCTLVRLGPAPKICVRIAGAKKISEVLISRVRWKE